MFLETKFLIIKSCHNDAAFELSHWYHNGKSVTRRRIFRALNPTQLSGLGPRCSIHYASWGWPIPATD